MFEISYKEIFEMLIECNKDINLVADIISINNSSIAVKEMSEFKSFLHKSFIGKFKTRWISVNRHADEFFKKYEDWLTSVYRFDQAEADEEICSNYVKRGRPLKPYELCQPRSKRNKVQELCASTSVELIRNAAKKIEPEHKILNVFSPEKALNLILDASLSKHQYDLLRYSAKEIGSDIYPLYSLVLAAKKECYPKNIEIMEDCCKVNLQDVLDHTAARILKSKSEEEIIELPNQMQLISKWGCDGSSGHSEYHQKFQNHEISDRSMFLTSIVPLNLEKIDEKLVYWRNKRPSSTRLCRPIQFKFVKETANVISEEVTRVQNEIKNLQKTEVTFFNKKIESMHKPVLYGRWV